jgi:hypothetical protein
MTTPQTTQKADAIRALRENGVDHTLNEAGVPKFLERKDSPEAALRRQMQADADKHRATAARLPIVTHPPRVGAALKPTPMTATKPLPIEATKQEKTMTPNTATNGTTKKTAPAAAKAKPKAKRTATEVRPGSKLEKIVKLLTRKQGCTAKEILDVCKWPSVSVPQQARAAGLKLIKQKNGDGVTVYRAG